LPTGDIEDGYHRPGAPGGTVGHRRVARILRTHDPIIAHPENTVLDRISPMENTVLESQ
jgi:hypothetical protein